MGQAQINVRTRACSRTFIARTKQAALTPHVRGKELIFEIAIRYALCRIMCITLLLAGGFVSYFSSTASFISMQGLYVFCQNETFRRKSRQVYLHF